MAHTYILSFFFQINRVISFFLWCEWTVILRFIFKETLCKKKKKMFIINIPIWPVHLCLVCCSVIIIFNPITAENIFTCSLSFPFAFYLPILSHFTSLLSHSGFSTNYYFIPKLYNLISQFPNDMILHTFCIYPFPTVCFTTYFSLYFPLLSVTHIPEHHSLHPFLWLLPLVLRPSRSLTSWWPSCWGTRPPSALWWRWSRGAVSSIGPLAYASHCLRPGRRVREILARVTLPASVCSAVSLVRQDHSTRSAWFRRINESGCFNSIFIYVASFYFNITTIIIVSGYE